MPNLTDLVSPQVYITEIDRTEYQSEQVGPFGALVIRNSWKGKENDIVLVCNENELIENFGMPHSNESNYCDMFSAIGFLKEANQLYCIRALPKEATYAGTLAVSGVSATFVPTLSANAFTIEDIPDPNLFAEEVVCEDPYFMHIISANRGYSGNFIRVAICDRIHYNMIRSKMISNWSTFSSIFSVDSPLESNKEFLILVQECKQGTDPNVESNWVFVEAWNVSTQQNKTDELGGSMFVENKVNSNSKYIKVSLNSNYKNKDIIGFATDKWQRLGGGINGPGCYNHDDWVEPSSEILNKALSHFENSEDNRVDIIIDGAKSIQQKIKMAQIANQRKDCIFIMDVPAAAVVNNKGFEERDLVQWVKGLYANYEEFNSSYCCVYGNWLDIRDKYSSKYRWVPPSGYVAGVFARCIREYEPWYAPAGLNRGQLFGIRRLAWNPSLSQRDAVYKFAINNIVSFSGLGKVVWSQKTMLDKESAFNQINVRMLFLTLKRQIGEAAKYYLFEPNTAIKRTQFVNQITPILEKAKGKEGVEDFMIVCDNTNNTPETIAKGELRCDIWIKPVYAIRYIRLSLIGSKSGTSFDEV